MLSNKILLLHNYRQIVNNLPTFVSVWFSSPWNTCWTSRYVVVYLPTLLYTLYYNLLYVSSLSAMTIC